MNIDTAQEGERGRQGIFPCSTASRKVFCFFLKKKKTKQEEGGGASGGSKCTSEMLWGLNHARIGGRLLKRLTTNLP